METWEEKTRTKSILFRENSNEWKKGEGFYFLTIISRYVTIPIIKWKG